VRRLIKKHIQGGSWGAALKPRECRRPHWHSARATPNQAAAQGQLCRVHAKDQTTHITEAIIDVLAVTLSLASSRPARQWRRQCGKASSRRWWRRGWRTDRLVGRPAREDGASHPQARPHQERCCPAPTGFFDGDLWKLGAEALKLFATINRWARLPSRRSRGYSHRTVAFGAVASYPTNDARPGRPKSLLVVRSRSDALSSWSRRAATGC
jgi:hypothetical protein